ncbi:sarcosine oxidase subunit alpha family protein [uncultured Roseobacter sp.]|uniref:sarcosine oxidase subunit alpha family protein n=1 Tax=uncultured Roseobacter sp. TaxID=114847 RepID=UPI00262B8DF2|nr:sarcosine oxidase subunit alpha family protein [uncultured Roseobacter sp.]
MRIDGKGLVDRSRPVRFQFDGIGHTGFEGDTVASALLAKGVRLMGRSFKYHRPRGVLTADSAEPNALITVGRGGRQEPNVRATLQEIAPGLEARAQNAWPSLRFDAMALNDLMWPFLRAGFYYKTFMWPRGFWERLYEPIIRRAAGLGALNGDPADGRFEKAYAFCDLLVIGAGPTGLMAALTAARAGADVLLVDEDSLPGGRLNAETHLVSGVPGAGWAAAAAAELADLPNARLMTRTTVVGAYDHGTYGALERGGPDRPAETFWRIVAERVILAAGAQERMVAFADNDRPGIMTASAVRAYLNRWGVASGQRIAVFGNNDDAHRTARDLSEAGVEVAAVIDSRADATCDLADVPFHAGAVVTGTRGRLGLRQITVKTDRGIREIDADCLAVSGGWNPTVHLSCHMNARPGWRADIAAFVPTAGSVPGMVAAGACAGDFSTAACLRAGQEAAREALGDLGQHVPPAAPLPKTEDTPYRIKPLWSVPGKGRAWLDFQNDVSVKDVAQAAAENFRSVEHMKRYTTQGMATDQGKTSNVAALAVLAEVTGREIPETGTTTFRPPYTTVSVAAFGAGGQGAGFAPERRITSHGAAVARGAPMIEAGLWRRHSYFPQTQENHWRQSCDREVAYVRQAVGVCDVSTLGKIDVQGPDAAAFLDVVYSNRMSTLAPGRVRYGLMLREDGFVMDDGTAARLGPEHFLLTATTAAAGLVMRHLEFVHQAHCPRLDLRLMSVTEHWAQFAVAGPGARALLNDLLDDPVDAEAWAFMACGPVTIGGVAARLFRISFSGEHAYEIAVPARYGESLFTTLVRRAEAMGGGAYGVEALNVLRIEKGHITHAEMDGRTTASDLGLERMISGQKDCIGKTMAARPGLVAEDRGQLVGIRPAGGDVSLSAGAHLFDRGAAVGRETSRGHVTSVAFSPTLGHHIALGLVAGGRGRIGDTMRLVDHMRGVDVMVEICAPVFVDPDGSRLRG